MLTHTLFGFLTCQLFDRSIDRSICLLEGFFYWRTFLLLLSLLRFIILITKPLSLGSSIDCGIIPCVESGRGDLERRENCST